MHFPFGYYPDPPGGTEIYVCGLARELSAMGVANVICAPGLHNGHYQHAGVPVWRFATERVGLSPSDLYGRGDSHAAAQVGRILDSERPELVHLHAFTSGVSLRVLRQAKRRGCRVVFTYHTPTVSCLRGTLLHLGREVCDGCLKTGRCARCMATHWGVPPALAFVLGRLPPIAGRVSDRLGLRGRIWTALRCRELIGLRHRAIRGLFLEVDHLVAVCGWVERLLLRNDVPREKITLCRQGVSTNPNSLPVAAEQHRHAKPALRLLFLGRLHPTKGVQDLIAAFREAPALSATLDIYGVAQDRAGEAYARELKAAAQADSRIRFRTPLPSENVVGMIRQYDLLAVPSRALETGPMVVLEAFAAGVPVIARNLGGMKELVRHEVDGLLIESPALQGWISALHRCVADAELLSRLRCGIQAPRTMNQVARETCSLYQALGRRN